MMNETAHERKQLVCDTIRHKSKPKRVPLFSNTWTWKICDAGYELNDALRDYDKLFASVCRHHEKYGYDMYIDMGTRNPIRFSDALGGGIYYIDEEKNRISYRDKCLMQADEYPLLIEKGLKRFYFEDVLERKYGWKEHDEAMRHLDAAMSEYRSLKAYTARVCRCFYEEYGVPRLNAAKPVLPADMLFINLRGVKGWSMDLRRNAEFMQQAMETIDAFYGGIVSDTLAAYRERDDTYMPFRFSSLSHNVMNPHQFGSYSWPYIKKITDELEKHDCIALFFAEGSVSRLTDFLREIPSGRIALLLEMDDPEEMKKKLPNLTIVGGYPVNLLADAGEQECIEAAKKLIDKMAYDGNYIFACNKMLSFPDDARGENMLAVNSFLREYTLY